jgi:hypothetical protein
VILWLATEIGEGLRIKALAEGRAAIIALLDIAAERRRPARCEGGHDASLDAPEMTGVRLSKRFAMAAEDIRQLQNRSHGARSAGWHDFQAEPIERARRVADGFGGDPGIARRACDTALLDPDHHPLAVDVSDLQENDFRHAQSGGIDSGQRDAAL